MADEEFAELAEINLSEQYGEPSWVGCGRSPSNNTGSLSHHRSASMFTPQAIVRAAEAEDIIGPYRSHIDGHRSGRGRSGMYYSPPGTSYTIVERSTPAPHNKHPRGSFLTGGNGSTSAHLTSSPAFTTAHTKSKAAAKSLSPEQVIKLLGGGTNLRKPAPAPERPASRLPPPPSIDQLTTKTVNMSRSVESGQGFGICVKGGIEDSGVGVYISRIEEGSVAERAGLRPGDSILEVNGTPFTSISHEEALKEYTDDSGYAPKSQNSESLKTQIAEMLKSSKYLSMTVRSPKKPPMNSFDSANQGNVWVLRQTYTWMNRQGRPTSPPPEYRTPLNHQNIHPRSLMDKIRKVDLNIEPGQSLGLMIRGGIEYNLGIFVTGVDKDSVADRAGILVGDQILEVNGQSFLEVTHDEAVGTLKHYKRMTLTVRDCDKVPHSCSSYDPRQTSVRHCEKSAASQMVEEKARIVLKKSEFSTLCYYLEEYNAQRISVESFVSVLTELLNTPDKYTLLTELREVLAPHDRTMFDELVYGQGLKDRNQTNRFIGSEFSKPAIFPTGAITGTTFIEPDEFRTPSEDSGLGLGFHDLGTGLSFSGRNKNCMSDPRRSPTSFLGYKRTSDLDLSNDAEYNYQKLEDINNIIDDEPLNGIVMYERVCHLSMGWFLLSTIVEARAMWQQWIEMIDFLSFGELDGAEFSANRFRRKSSLDEGLSRLEQNSDQDVNMSGYMDDLRSRLGGWTEKVKSWYLGNPLMARTHGHNLGSSEEGEQLLGGDSKTWHNTTDPNNSLMENESNIVPDDQGNLRIRVKKMKPLLGIAIEGGANTKHPLPRIINIHENGAAFDASGLEVGQLILEVDGHKVEGMQHQEVARLIAESFARREKNYIEFLVIEAKKSNLEPKPTALIFLES